MQLSWRLKLEGSLISKSFVYKCYKEWRYGQEERAIANAKEGKKCAMDERGWFEKIIVVLTRGSSFLMKNT